MQRQLIFLAIFVAYWLAVGVGMVAVVKIWPALADSPWLFAVFAPFFLAGFVMRGIMRRKLLAEKRGR